MSISLVDQSSYQPDISYNRDLNQHGVPYLDLFVEGAMSDDRTLDFNIANHRYVFAAHVIRMASKPILQVTFVEAFKRCALFALSFFASLGQILGIRDEHNLALNCYVGIASSQIQEWQKCGWLIDEKLVASKNVSKEANSGSLSEESFKKILTNN